MVGCQGSRGTEKREGVARLPNDETELYRILAEHIRDGIYILDREGYFTYVNDVIVRRSGYPPGWFYERTYLDVIRPGDREKTEQNFRALIEGRKVDSYEVAYPTSSGRVLWVEVNTSPIVRDGEVIGLLGLSRDVTARKEVERALAESEQLFRGLAEQAPLGVAILKDYEVRYINEAGAHVFGSPVGQIMEWGQEGLLNHVHPADLPAVVEHAQGLLRGEIEVLRNFIYRIIQDSGEIRWVEQYASRITFHGESAVLMSFVDITDRIHAEEALRRSENLYRSTIDAMMDPLHVVERDLTIVLHNRRLVEWARDVGVETDFLGRRVFDVFPFLPRRVRQ
ncbi:MAG TPA: PAS domain S-box protein, partial [Thermoplasmata archaeon]|nr:PAS domain S-box protein [Thermoplasmata archaeon]